MAERSVSYDLPGRLSITPDRALVVRDGVDPSTSGFSDRHSHLLHTPLTWENATADASRAGPVGPALVNRRENSSLSGMRALGRYGAPTWSFAVVRIVCVTSMAHGQVPTVLTPLTYATANCLQPRAQLLGQRVVTEFGMDAPSDGTGGLCADARTGVREQESSSSQSSSITFPQPILAR